MFHIHVVNMTLATGPKCASGLNESSFRFLIKRCFLPDSLFSSRSFKQIWITCLDKSGERDIQRRYVLFWQNCVHHHQRCHHTVRTPGWPIPLTIVTVAVVFGVKFNCYNWFVCEQIFDFFIYFTTETQYSISSIWSTWLSSVLYQLSSVLNQLSSVLYQGDFISIMRETDGGPLCLLIDFGCWEDSS